MPIKYTAHTLTFFLVITYLLIAVVILQRLGSPLQIQFVIRHHLGRQIKMTKFCFPYILSRDT